MERFKKNCLETVRSLIIQYMAKIFISKGLKFQEKQWIHNMHMYTLWFKYLFCFNYSVQGI